MKKLAVVVVVLALGAGGARAGSWSVGASAGYTLGGDVEENSFAPGVQALWMINDTWSLELGVFQFSDEGGETEEGVVWVSEVDATPLTATLLAYVPLGETCRGYLGAGAAFYLLDVSSRARLTAQTEADSATWEVDADNGYGVHVLAGVNWTLTDALSAFADVRYAVMAYDYDGEWTERFGGETYSGTESDTEDYYYGMMRLGLSWQL